VEKRGNGKKGHENKRVWGEPDANDPIKRDVLVIPVRSDSQRKNGQEEGSVLPVI